MSIEVIEAAIFFLTSTAVTFGVIRWDEHEVLR